MTRLRWGSATDVGRVRANNQDHVLVTGSLFAVADGMGGHVGGEIASQTAINALQKEFEKDSSIDSLIKSAKNANKAVWQRSQKEANLKGMGTTLTAVGLIKNNNEEELGIVNVGDSRAYLLQNGELSQITEDHSLVEEAVRSGQLSAEEAIHHSSRHILTRAIGIEQDVEVDNWIILPYKGDRILLCSDGLINEVDDSHIAQILREHKDPQKAADFLVEKAKSNGGSDNISVVVIDILEDEVSTKATSTNPTSLSVDSTPHKNVIDDLEYPSAAPISSFTPSKNKSKPLHAMPKKKIFTLRVVIFIFLLLLVIGGAIGVVDWYAKDSYFVGLKKNQIVIFQGRPGGVLWFKPQIVDKTPYNTSQILAFHIASLEAGQKEPSFSASKRFVHNLIKEAKQQKTFAANTPPPVNASSTTTSTGLG